EVVRKIERGDTAEFLAPKTSAEKAAAESAASVVEALTTDNRQLTTGLNSALLTARKRKKQLIAAVIIACAGIIGSIRGHVFFQDEIKRSNGLSAEKERLTTQVGSLTSERNTITAERDTLKTQLSAAQAELAKYKKAAESARVASVISVREMSVGNWGKNFWGTEKWLTEPGGKLTAREIQYLSPVFSYNASVNKTLTFYIAIKNPSGTIIKGGGSPANYTCSFQGDVRSGGNTLYASDWGSDSGGIYYPGTWTIELWYEGVQLYSGKVTLN
ncbi:MAG: hypothetical protein LBC77_03275, partial [Spirochaetaceae bacterium]|nr:hypothetical protein [Spirochaetaceae bacterium]